MASHFSTIGMPVGSEEEMYELADRVGRLADETVRTKWSIFPLERPEWCGTLVAGQRRQRDYWDEPAFLR